MIKLAGTANDVLSATKTGVIAVGPEDTVLHALEVLAKANIGAVMVLRAGTWSASCWSATMRGRSS